MSRLQEIEDRMIALRMQIAGAKMELNALEHEYSELEVKPEPEEQTESEKLEALRDSLKAKINTGRPGDFTVIRAKRMLAAVEKMIEGA
jgi:hypothetical protein